MLPELLSSASLRNSMSHWNDFQRDIVSLKIVQCDISFRIRGKEANIKLSECFRARHDKQLGCAPLIFLVALQVLMV